MPPPRFCAAWAGVWLGAFALAYPPAPHHTFFGSVRNEWGDPIDVTGAVVFVQSGTARGVTASVTASTEPGVNYRLVVPMDSGATTDPYQVSALRQNQTFQLKVQIGTRSYLPIEMAASSRQIGLPAGITRLDLTLGEDTDGDGLPDVWERALIAVLGGGLTLQDIRPEDDLDHDGSSNRDEYLAGTYPFDPTDGFRLRIVSASPAAFALEFLALRGRTYTLWTSDDLSQWTPVAFRVPAEGSGSPLYDHFPASSVRFLQVEVPPPAGSITNRYFKATVQ